MGKQPATVKSANKQTNKQTNNRSIPITGIPELYAT